MSKLLKIGLPIVIVLALVGGGVWWFTRRAQSATAAASVKTAEVTAITAITRVESSGSIQPRQLASLAWKTTGQVALVNVKPGDHVKAGDVLLELDPVSAPANVISAQADLINAQKSLDDLLQPSAVSLADARKAVADAQKNLEDKERTLRYTVNPDVAYYQDQYNQALWQHTQAQQNVEKTNIGDLNKAVQNAKDTLQKKTDQLNDAKQAQASCPGCERVFAASAGRLVKLADVQKEYDDAVNALRVAELNLEQSQANNGQTLQDKQDGLTTAQANLDAAKRGPDATKRAQAEADVAVAQARLADAQDKLNKLLNGADPSDLASAQARLQGAQASVASLKITAPFDSEVLEVNYLPGDPVDQSKAAVVLVNRAQLHVDVRVDETEVMRIQIGDAAAILLDALPGVEFAGTVDSINPQGETVNGLVKYTVRVNLLPAADMPTLLGATANTAIVTDVQANVLAVPLEAVQSDEQGEYVNRMNADGTKTRVNVRSGSFQDDLVTVTGGGLQPGDRIEIPAPRPTNIGGPFGG